MTRKNQTTQTPADRRTKIVRLLNEARDKLKEAEALFQQEQMHGYLGKVRTALEITNGCYVSYNEYNIYLQDRGR